MIRTVLSATVLLLAACAAPKTTPTDPADFSFMGSWDCGVSVMTFLPDGYMPSNDDQPIAVTRYEIQGETTRITLQDGAQISVQPHDDGSLTWLSHSTGDTFNCTRIAG